jgi:hypothetical protein
MGYNLDGYVTVPERIALFYKRYPEGSLQSDPPEWAEVEGKRFLIVKAYAYRTPDDQRPGIGHAWEIVPGTTPYTRGSELMNGETSAWGRAIGALGIGIDKSIATVDEINAAKSRQTITSEPTPADDPFYTQPENYTPKDKIMRDPDGEPTAKQLAMLKALLKKAGAGSADEGLGMIHDHQGTMISAYEELTKAQASDLITHYKGIENVQQAFSQ